MIPPKQNQLVSAEGLTASEYSAATLFHEGVVFLVGKAIEEEVFAIVVVHEGHHVLHTLGNWLPLHVELNTQLLHGFLLLCNTRHCDVTNRWEDDVTGLWCVVFCTWCTLVLYVLGEFEGRGL